MALDVSDRPFSKLMSDTLSQVSALLRAEMNLARAETSDKLKDMMSSAAMVAIGAIVGLAGFLILLMAAVEFLVLAGLGRHWATLIVAVVTLGAGAIAAMKGINDLKERDLTPNRTIRQFSRDVQTARGVAQERVS